MSRTKDIANATANFLKQIGGIAKNNAQAAATETLNSSNMIHQFAPHPQDIG